MAFTGAAFAVAGLAVAAFAVAGLAVAAFAVAGLAAAARATAGRAPPDALAVALAASDDEIRTCRQVRQTHAFIGRGGATAEAATQGGAHC